MRRETLTPWTSISLEPGFTDADVEVACWLNDVFGTDEGDGMFWGRKQLFLYGPTLMRKTTLIKALEQFFSCFQIPRDEDYYDFYSDSIYDLAYMDEFKGNKTIQWMNTWLDGATFVLRQKGAQIIKSKNIPTIIISNYSLRECYSKVDEMRFATIDRRLKQVHVTSPLTLPNTLVPN